MKTRRVLIVDGDQAIYGAIEPIFDEQACSVYLRFGQAGRLWRV